LLMFITFSLLPSCLLILPPGTIQVNGNLSHHWGPNGGCPRGNELEGMFGCLGCPQGHGLLTTLELPTFYGITLQYCIESEEAVDSMSRWVCESE
jgi:hypothetical protein